MLLASGTASYSGGTLTAHLTSPTPEDLTMAFDPDGVHVNVTLTANPAGCSISGTVAGVRCSQAADTHC